jgi:hypothetical protein
MPHGCKGAAFWAGNKNFMVACKHSTKNSDAGGSFFRENCYLCLVAGGMPAAVYGQFFRVVKAALPREENKT